MSARVKRGHGEFVFVGKGATDFRALSRFRSGELVSINMASNRLTSMLGLAQHASMVSLDLSHNLIESIDGLEGLAHLQVLRLHHNHLTSLDGLDQLQLLQLLDVNNNDLTSIAELRRCTALTELDVSCNALSELDDISSLHRLATLSFRGNLLKLLDRLPACLPASLRKLDLAQNSIGEVSELQNLRSLHSLEHVDVSENVFVATSLQHGFSYRPLAVAFVPGLRTLDGDPVTRDERLSADRLFNGDARANLALLEVGQEASLLAFLADQCPANHGVALASGVRSDRRSAPAPVLSGVEPAPTAAQFAELEQQVKEMRRYFKQYVRTEARKRDRAARLLQACVLGHIVRKHLSRHLRPRRVRRPGRNDDVRQVQLSSPTYEYADRGGAYGRTARAHAGIRPPVSQRFNPDRYQLVQPSLPQGLGYRPSSHGSRVGGDKEHGAAQRIQARHRGILARRRLADYQNCKEGAVRIQAAYRGMAERRRLGITGRPMYPCGHKQRSAQMPGSMGASGRGTDKAIGFAALADVAEELRELQRWRSAQEEAMRFLWEEVRQLRDWKAARMEADSYLVDDERAGASVEMARQLTKMRVEVDQLKSRLVQRERDDGTSASAFDVAPDGDVASHLVQAYRLEGLQKQMPRDRTGIPE